MIDIVKRLHETYLVTSYNSINGCSDCGIASNDATEAADTITALRAENERLCAALLGEETEHSKRVMEVEALRAEVERLRAMIGDAKEAIDADAVIAAYHILDAALEERT